MSAAPRPPTSVTDLRVGLLGLLAMAAATAGLLHVDLPVHLKAAALMAATAAPMVLLDLAWRRVHLRPSTGLDWSKRDFDPERIATRLVGLAGALGAVVGVYHFTPEYQGRFYDPWYALLWAFGPWVALASAAWMAWTDGRMVEPRDGYWHLGRLLTLRWSGVDREKVADLLRTWAVKGFFTPLMLVYLCNNLGELRNLTDAGRSLLDGMHWFDVAWSAGFLVDVTFTTLGYLLTVRALDTHVRSAQPTMTGWVAALVCYQPFWSLINGQYLFFEGGYHWGEWLADLPAVKAAWGAVLVALLAVFSLSTVAFGCRFSNLTHRGIVTSGPYRFTKHPAYLSKIASFWMIYVPFLYRGSAYEVVRDCLWLSALSGVYWLRARTEEQHLSTDPDYVRYALWIDEHGLFAPVGRVFPFLRYRPPPGAPEVR